MTFVHLFETCNQDSSAVLALPNNVSRRLKDVMPHLQSIYLRQDNAGYYHYALTLVTANNDQIPYGHPFEFRPRYRVGISNAGGNRIIWRCPWSKSSVVQTSFVFHQKSQWNGMLWALSTTFRMARKVWEYGDPATNLEEANSFLGARSMFLTRTKFQHLNAVQQAKT